MRAGLESCACTRVAKSPSDSPETCATRSVPHPPGRPVAFFPSPHPPGSSLIIPIMQVLPAAQPSFLQEIAVLDHPSKRPATASGTNGSKSRRESEESASEASDSDSDVSRSSISSLSELDGGKDSADEEKQARREKKQARKDKKEAKKKKKQKPAQEIPADSLVLLGQTSKKFIVVPDMQDLLDKVGQEERAEKEAERRAKLEKANRAAAIAKKREGTAAPRR